MSLFRIFQGVLGRLARFQSRFQSKTGGDADAALNQDFATELYTALSSDAPITLSGPIKLRRSYSGPAIQVDGSDAAIGYVQNDGSATGRDADNRRVRVQQILDDILIVRPDDGHDFPVAKPDSLRRSTYDQKTIADVTYLYSGPQSRQANGIDEQVTPLYSLNDELVIARVVSGFAIKGPDGNVLEFTDTNVAARHWQATSAAGTGWRILRPQIDYESVLPRFNVLDVSQTKAIASTTNATPIEVTTTANHGLITGQMVIITGCSVGAVNGTWIITRSADNKFTLDGSTAPGSTSSGTGTVQHEMIVTVDVSGEQRPSHGFRSGTHVTIEGVLGSTEANGTFTIDAGTIDVLDKTSSSGEVLITTFLPHGFADGEKIRVESLEKGRPGNVGYLESEGTWEIDYVSDTSFKLPGSTFELAYDRGGLCSRATTFRLIENDKAWNGRRAYVIGDVVVVDLVRYTCKLGHTNQKPPNGTYWDVVAPGTYTSGGKVIRPGRVTITSATPSLTPLSNGAARRAAIATAEARGFGLGLPIRISSQTNTIIGVIVGVPGEEGFPYTDPAPLPFYLDNELAYMGPPLTSDISDLAVGTAQMVSYDRMACNVLPFYGSECELPITPLDYNASTRFRTVGGGASYAFYGKNNWRWDKPSARIVGFAMQQDVAGINGDWGAFSGGTVAIVPDCRRPGIFTGGIPIETSAANWINSQPYFAGELVKESGSGTLYICTQSHNIDGSGESKDPATAGNVADDGTKFWRSLHATTLVWSNATAYVRGDIVKDNNVLYICVLANTNKQPTSGSNVPTYWRETALSIAPVNWSATNFVVGNVVTKGHVVYRCILDTVSNDEPPNATYWELASRESYEDGAIVPGSRVTREANANLFIGHPDTGCVGWRFVHHGIVTHVRSLVQHPPKTITNITDATPNVVTTLTDHELRTGAVVTISGCDQAVCNGTWQVIRKDADEFILESSTDSLSADATVGLVMSHSFRSAIVEDLDLPEGTAQKYFLADYPLQPKVNLDVGGQMLSTNDNNTGTRSNRDDKLAAWNPPNEINPNSYDIVYNSRAGIAATGVGNQPGLKHADENELTTYVAGTITIDNGVVTLSGGYFPQWALHGEIVVEGDTAVLTVKDAADWDAGVAYLIGQLSVSDVSGAPKVYIAITNNSGSEPSANPADWTDLGATAVTSTATTWGYSTHLQLSNVAYNALPGSKYVLRPQGIPAQWLIVFLTIVDVE
jgi:hypothetical protein